MQVKALVEALGWLLPAPSHSDLLHPSHSSKVAPRLFHLKPDAARGSACAIIIFWVS